MELRLASFAGREGDRFTARPASGGPALELVLSACTRSRFAAPGQEAFSLTFHAAAHAGAGQQTFELSHAELGSAPLFLVPLGPEAEGMAYEAVVNRLVDVP